ncbi:hypothetical protein NUSPORA_01794 [Nucleospora cyclopteri]
MNDRAFMIADINGRFNGLLRKNDYNSLKQCRTMDEITIKLSQRFYFIHEDMSYKDLRSKFVENIIDELKEFELLELNYFIEYYKIINFFNKLDNIDELLIGKFPELKVIDLCKSFEDVQKLCINNCFLKKYFINVKKDENQRMMLKVLKNFMDKTYKNACGYFKEILQHEGNRQILEICLNGKNLEDKIQYFPAANTFTGSELNLLAVNCDIDEIKRIFKAGEGDPINLCIKNIMRIYSDSFNQFSDASCIYSYFKLKEQELENIMWIIECVLQEAGDKIDEIISIE